MIRTGSETTPCRNSPFPSKNHDCNLKSQLFERPYLLTGNSNKVDSWSLKSATGLLVKHQVVLNGYGHTVKIHPGKVATFQTFKQKFKMRKHFFK
jgi:hypothetical protein